jgi:hypothetical protein
MALVALMALAFTPDHRQIHDITPYSPKWSKGGQIFA